MMRVLQLIQEKQARGAEKHAVLLANMLKENSIHTDVMALKEGGFDLGFEGEIKVLNADLTKRFWDFPAWKDLANYINSNHIDIVQANGADTLKYAVFSKKLFGWKAKIIFYNGSMVSQYIGSFLKKRFNRWLYTNLDQLIAVSDSVAEDFEGLFPDLHFKQIVIPAGIRMLLKKEKEIYSSPIFVHIGGFTFEKNHLGLIRIFEKIRMQKPDALLWLFGEGPLKDEIHSFVKNMGLKDAVIFKGTHSFPFQNIPGNAVLLLPSLVEGLPAVVLEGLTLGIRTIVYDVGELGALYQKYQLEDIVASGEEQKFAEKAIQVHTNYIPVPSSVSTSICEEFAIKKQISKWKEIYQLTLQK